MAGRNQHHVPQLIQRGFGRPKGKTTQVVVYRSEKKTFTTNTRNFGAERDFYANGADTLVDDLITEYEGDLVGLVASLRDSNPQALERKTEISDLIAHLEIRTKSLRVNIANTADTVFELLDNWFSDPRTLEKMISNHLSRNPSYIVDELVKRTKDRNLASKMSVTLKPMLPALIADFAPGIAAQFSAALRMNTDTLNSMPRDTHLKVLRKGIVPDGRAKKYSSFRYKFVHFPNDLLLLPDTMVAFKTTEGFRAMAGDLDQVSDILLPIGSHLMIVGSRSEFPNFDYQQTINALSSCAFEAFVAESEENHLNMLRQNIGRNAKLISEEEMAEVFGEVFQELVTS